MNYITSDATEGVPEVRKNIGVRPNLFLVALTASSICLTGVREFCTFLDKKKWALHKSEGVPTKLRGLGFSGKTLNWKMQWKRTPCS